MISKPSEILPPVLSAVLLLSFSGGCREFTPPADDELISHLDAHELEFEAIVGILNGFPYDSLPGRYPPFDLSRQEDSLFQEKLGEEGRARLDSLLERAGCECVHTYSYHLLEDEERHKGYTFQLYVDGFSLGSSIEKSLVYVLDGEDAAKSEKSQFNYNSERNYADSIFTVTSDTGLYHRQMRTDPKIHDASIRRHIRANWLIYLSLD